MEILTVRNFTVVYHEDGNCLIHNGHHEDVLEIKMITILKLRQETVSIGQKVGGCIGWDANPYQVMCSHNKSYLETPVPPTKPNVLHYRGNSV